MDILIVAGIVIGLYYLSKRQQPSEITLVQQGPVEEGPFPTVGYRALVDFSTSMPVPVSYEPSFGKTEFAFNITAEWKNLDATWDIIVFMIGDEVITTLHPRTISGRETVPVKVSAVPGGQRQLAMIVKNVEGIEHIKAAAYEMINLGQVV